MGCLGLNTILVSIPKYNNPLSVDETTNKTKLINDPDVRTIRRGLSSNYD